MARHDHPPEAGERESGVAFAGLIDGGGHRRRERLARRSGHALHPNDEHRIRGLRANEIVADANARAARGAGGFHLHRNDIFKAEVCRNDRSQKLLPGHDAANEITDEQPTNAIRR